MKEVVKEVGKLCQTSVLYQSMPLLNAKVSGRDKLVTLMHETLSLQPYTTWLLFPVQACLPQRYRLMRAGRLPLLVMLLIMLLT